MDFSAYKGFEQRFTDRYAAYERTHPFSLMVLELNLRNALFGDDAIARKNLGRQTDHLWLADQILKLAAKGRAPGPQVYLELPGFAALSQDLGQRFEAAGVGIFSNRRIMAQPANKLLHRLIKLGPTYAKAMALGGAQGPDAVLADTGLLDRLDAELSANYQRLKRFVQAQNIRGFVATGDCQPFSRFLCRAARELGLPYVVLAHGYVAHRTLVSIAPLHGDELIVWTERQAKLMRAALPERASDIHSFGFPIRTAAPDRSLRERRVLFAWEPLLRPGKFDLHLPVLTRLAQASATTNFTPIMRLHPKERKDADLNSRLAAIGFEMDADDMTRALSRAAVVVSSSSTVLSEAAAFGIPAVQITELANFEFEGAIPVPAAQFDPEAAAATETGTPAFPLMDVNRLFAHLSDLISHATTRKVR